MARPKQSAAKRRELLPLLAGTFAELGYRRTTTAELARRCGVQETTLYRLWPDKKSMFLAAIDAVFESSEKTWLALEAGWGAEGCSAERLLEYEAQHHGEFGLYRILFAGLSETDDEEIRAALQRVYGRFHQFICERIVDRVGLSGARRRNKAAERHAELAAWALLGMGTAVSIGRELGLLGDEQREQLFQVLGKQILDGAG